MREIVHVGFGVWLFSCLSWGSSVGQGSSVWLQPYVPVSQRPPIPTCFAPGPLQLTKCLEHGSRHKCSSRPRNLQTGCQHPLLSSMLLGLYPRGMQRRIRTLTQAHGDLEDPGSHIIAGNSEEYALVQAGTTWTIRALSFGGNLVNETFHPGRGVIAEGEGLYVQQLKLRERFAGIEQARGEFIMWDVGLGACGNAIVALNALDKAGCKRARMVSFDRTVGAAVFALQHLDKLGYLDGWETTLRNLLDTGRTTVTMPNGCEIVWENYVGDFPSLLRSTPLGGLPSADAIMYDAFSPVRCPEMWNLETLKLVREHASNGGVPCMLSTSSRSTIVRTSLLCAGFYVGIGGSTSGTAFQDKEETTIAATSLDLLRTPLQKSWLARVGRSSAAEPLRGIVYSRAAASMQTLSELQCHAQFSCRLG